MPRIPAFGLHPGYPTDVSERRVRRGAEAAESSKFIFLCALGGSVDSAFRRPSPGLMP